MRPITVTQTGAGNSATIPLDLYGQSDVSLQVIVSGTVNWDVEQTLDDPFGTAALTWLDHPDTNMVGQTVNRQGNYSYVPRAVRLVVNSGTGSATLTVIQPGANQG